MLLRLIVREIYDFVPRWKNGIARFHFRQPQVYGILCWLRRTKCHMSGGKSVWAKPWIFLSANPIKDAKDAQIMLADMPFICMTQNQLQFSFDKNMTFSQVVAWNWHRMWQSVKWWLRMWRNLICKPKIFVFMPQSHYEKIRIIKQAGKICLKVKTDDLSL